MQGSNRANQRINTEGKITEVHEKGPSSSLGIREAQASGHWKR